MQRPPSWALQGDNRDPVKVSVFCVVEVQAAPSFLCANISSLSQRTCPPSLEAAGRQVGWKRVGAGRKAPPHTESGIWFVLDAVTAAISFPAHAAEISHGHSGLQNCRGEELGYCSLVFSDTAASVQHFAEKQSLLLELPTRLCAHCESRFTEKICSAFFVKFLSIPKEWRDTVQ